MGVAVDLLSIVSQYGDTYNGQACPAEWLNGQRYAGNGRKNLLISGAVHRVDMDQQMSLSPERFIRLVLFI